MNTEKLIESLKKHEGCSRTAYRDSKGVWTIGYGRNLQAMTITVAQALAWLNEDMISALWAAQQFPEYRYLNTDARQNAFVEMVFNMGAEKVEGFKKMLPAIAAHNWTGVAKHALDSDWAKQVGQRAVTLAEMLRTGEFPHT